MCSTKNKLEVLLNDESFIRWLRGEATPSQKREWDIWLEEETAHRELVRKAKKLLNIPFIHVEQLDIKEELNRLKRALSELENEEGRQNTD